MVTTLMLGEVRSSSAKPFRCDLDHRFRHLDGHDGSGLGTAASKHTTLPISRLGSRVGGPHVGDANRFGMHRRTSNGQNRRWVNGIRPPAELLGTAASLAWPVLVVRSHLGLDGRRSHGALRGPHR